MAGQDEREISGRIRQARKAAGLTKPELAERIGVGERTVTNYESGRVPWALLTKIADATGTTRAWLVDGPSQLDRMEAKLDQLVSGLLRPPGEAEAGRRMPKPPPAPRPQKASAARPRKARKAS